jgi:hypothetical protein
MKHSFLRLIVPRVFLPTHLLAFEEEISCRSTYR